MINFSKTIACAVLAAIGADASSCGESSDSQSVIEDCVTDSMNELSLLGTSGEEVSLPLSNESHGLFTYYLLRKLKETKGNVTLDELKNYLKAELPRASLIENSMKQSPQVLVAPDLGDKWLTWKLR